MQHQLKYIPITELKVSALNMRHGRKAPEIDDIYPSILKRGVYQTMIVRREGTKWGVVAGRRRLFALRRKAKETGKKVTAPCILMGEGDDAAAVEASIIENVGHLPATEMQQYEAFGKLVQKGRSIAEVAGYFGITDLKVKRVLALANLIDPIRDLYTREEIDPETIRILTLATPARQQAWLDLYASDDSRAPTGRYLKDWLAGGTAISADKALFDLVTYPGRIIENLFADHGQFEETDLFWEHQNAAIAVRIEAYRERGWQDVVVLERGAFFHAWDHVKCPKKKGGKIYISIRHTGEVEFHEGYISQAEHAKALADTCVEAGSTAPKPELSGPLTAYLALHRHGAVRAALLDAPEVALRLMVAHAMAGSPLWDVRCHKNGTIKDATEASLIAAPASEKLGDAQMAVAELFKEKGVKPCFRENGDPYRLCEIFAALLKMDDNEVMQVLTFVMCETLASGTSTVEALAHVLEMDMGKWWQADDAFFDLLRNKQVINAMVAEVAGDATAKACLTDTAKAQKQTIRNRIAGASSSDEISAWRPRWMQRQPAPYIDGASNPLVDAWTRIAGLFEARKSDPV